MANENNIDYDGKSFIPKLNSVNGEVSEQTVFITIKRILSYGQNMQAEIS